MSIWEDHHLRDRIQEILDDQVYGEPFHHLRRPFMSPYQIALEYRQRYRESFDRIGMAMGGSGSGETNSFPQYIGRELSTILSHTDSLEMDIEGGFLANNFLTTIEFDNSGEPLLASTVRGAFPMSIFRSTRPVTL